MRIPGSNTPACDDRNKRLVFLIVILSVLSFAYKLFILSQRSQYFGIDPDEGYYLLLARNLMMGRGYTLNGLPNIIFPPLLPFLIACVSKVFSSYQISLNVITATAGTIMGPLSYLIARKRLNVFRSLLCCFLVLFIPELNLFQPISDQYINVLYRGSDIFNCCLILFVVYFTILLAETGRNLWAVFSGFFLGLSYLTRPEAIILFMVLLILLFIGKVLRYSLSSWRNLLLLAVTFIAFSFPYIYYLHNTTGAWMLSGKVAASQKYRIAMLEVIHNNDWRSFNSIQYSLNDNSTEMNDPYFGYSNQSDHLATDNPEPFPQLVFNNLSAYWIIPIILFAFPLIPFFIAGLAKALFQLRKDKSYYYVVILSLFLYSLIIESLSYPIPRHHIFLVPIYILLACVGLSMLNDLFILLSVSGRQVRKLIILMIRIFIFAYIIIVNSLEMLLVISGGLYVENGNIIISQRLFETKADVIMSRYPEIAVRALSDWQVLPEAPLINTLKFAKIKNVDYIVFQDEQRPFYRIVDVNNSDWPPDSMDQYSVVIVERAPTYEIICYLHKE